MNIPHGIQLSWDTSGSTNGIWSFTSPFCWICLAVMNNLQTLQLYSMSLLGTGKKQTPKQQWMKIIQIGQCICNYPAAFPGLDGCGKQQHCLSRFCSVPLLLACCSAFILAPLICVFLVVFCQAELLTRVGETGGSSIRISETWDFIRFRRNRLNEPVHCLFIAWLV